MIARFFHAWERHLASISKDRVVRPFDWGLDWIAANGRSRNGSPEAVLHGWADAALADSQKFFDLPGTPAYSFQESDGTGGMAGTLRFASAIETPHPENNTVVARYFPVSPRASTRRAVLVLPQWNSDAQGH